MGKAGGFGNRLSIMAVRHEALTRLVKPIFDDLWA